MLDASECAREGVIRTLKLAAAVNVNRSALFGCDAVECDAFAVQFAVDVVEWSRSRLRSHAAPLLLRIWRGAKAQIRLDAVKFRRHLRPGRAACQAALQRGRCVSMGWCDIFTLNQFVIMFFPGIDGASLK